MKEGKIKDRVIRGSILSLLVSVISKTGTLITTVILARFLLPQGFGEFSLIFSLAMSFYTFADIGINFTLTRYLSSAFKGNQEKLSSYYSLLLRYKWYLTLAISLIMILASYPISVFLLKNELLTLPIIFSALYVFALSFDTFYTQIFYVIEKVEYVAKKEAVFLVFRLLGIILVMISFVKSYALIGVFTVYTLVATLSILYSIYFFHKHCPNIFLQKKARIDKNKVKNFLKHLSIGTIAQGFFNYVDVIILGFFVLPEYVGYYRAAIALTFGIMGVLAFPQSVLFTITTKLNKKNANKLISKAFYYLSALTIPACFGIFVLGRHIIRLLYGYDYGYSVMPLIILTPTIFFGIIIVVLSSFFSAQERPEYFTKLVTFSLIFNIISNVTLTWLFLHFSQYWATYGAAISTSMSWMVYSLGMIYYAKKEFSLVLPWKSLTKPLLASLLMSLTIYLILTFIGQMSIYSGILLVAVGILVYLSFLYFFKGLNAEDLKSFKSQVKFLN